MGKAAKFIPAPLLYSRPVTAAVLGGINVASVRRMEDDGLLTVIRPTGKPNGAVFHSAKQVCAIAGCDPADAAVNGQVKVQSDQGKVTE